TLVAGRQGRQAALIDWDSGEPRILKPKGSRERHVVKAVAFATDGAFLAAASGLSIYDPIDLQPPGFLDVYQLSDGKCLASIPGDQLLAATFSPDGRLLLTGGEDRLLRVYDVPSWQPRCTLDGHVGRITAIAFAPDGQMLATASADGTIRFWPWHRLLGEEAPAKKEEPHARVRPAAKRPARGRRRSGDADGC